MLVIDDLQLADRPSLDTLSLLSIRFPHNAIHVVGTWTYYGADRPVNRRAFEGLLTSQYATVVHLGGIDREAAAGLVDRVAGAPVAPEVSEQVWRRADGNPFYIRELALTIDIDGHQRLTEATLPDAVVGVVGRRLGALDRPARHALAAAAVVGPQFDVGDLCRTSSNYRSRLCRNAFRLPTRRV